MAILQPSRKRGAVVGLVREDPFGKALMLMPCDPRMPMCLLRSSELPAELKASLKVSLPALGRTRLEGTICLQTGVGHGSADLRCAADCLSWGDLALESSHIPQGVEGCCTSQRHLFHEAQCRVVTVR